MIEGIRVIDAHCHIYPANIAAKAIAGTAVFYNAELNEQDGSVETVIREDNKGGIDFSLVCSVATTPHQVGSINRFIASVTVEHPDRIGGIGTLHPLSENQREDVENWKKIAAIALACVITLPSDWSCVATVAILFMGTYRGNFRKQMTWMMVWSFTYVIVYFFCIDKVYALVQLCTCLTIPLLRLYNGERGTWKGMGKLFYAYYPVHLVLLGVLRLLIWGGGSNTWSGT